MGPNVVFRLFYLFDSCDSFRLVSQSLDTNLLIAASTTVHTKKPHDVQVKSLAYFI